MLAKMYRNVCLDRSPDAISCIHKIMRHQIIYACMHGCMHVCVCVCVCVACMHACMCVCVCVCVCVHVCVCACVCVYTYSGSAITLELTDNGLLICHYQLS